MKKYVVLLIFLAVSCNKKADAVPEVTPKLDSVAVQKAPDEPQKTDSAKIKDSIVNNAPATKKVLESGVMRSEQDGDIIREVDAEQLPFRMGEEFTSHNQRFILKIKNYNKPAIQAEINTDVPNMNIRFNQIRLADGTFDGPFSREISHKTPGKGEVWLIIGKSNMASGTVQGKFTVSVR